jgi:aspartate carbamoyltransferase catalytic subunit
VNDTDALLDTSELDGRHRDGSIAFVENLVSIRDLSRQQIDLVLDTAETFREISERTIKKVPTLRGKTIVNLFFEPSTRTRTSFEIAGKRLSADVQSVAASTSSVVKGETLLDTTQNIEAMAPDILVMRHASSGAAEFLARNSRAAVVNAGDGTHEHPTQALLDALTIRQAKGSFEGLRVAIVGDITHSRVARSNILCLRKLGAHVVVAGPPTLIPVHAEALGCEVHRRMEPAVDGADVVMMLRVQVERGGNLNLPSTQEYFKLFGLDERRLALAADDAVVMHPGPMNRGVEIASSVADGPRSLILQQVSNGLAARMAILYLLAGGNPRHAETSS